jgi:hypothetical protein
MEDWPNCEYCIELLEERRSSVDVSKSIADDREMVSVPTPDSRGLHNQS